MVNLGEGLRPHYHQYYLHDIKRYYDNDKGCLIKHVTFRCMICGKEYHERYECAAPKAHSKGTKSLKKNKQKHRQS